MAFRSRNGACGAGQGEQDFCKIFKILYEWESYFDENLSIEAYKNHVNPWFSKITNRGAR